MPKTMDTTMHRTRVAKRLPWDRATMLSARIMPMPVMDSTATTNPALAMATLRLRHDLADATAMGISLLGPIRVSFRRNERIHVERIA